MTVISGCVRCHQLIWSGGRPWLALDGSAECPEGGPHQPRILTPVKTSR